MEKSGLIVEGGGMKCAYSAGILDAFLDDNVTFDYCMGVSAGAANTASYLAGQRGRNLRFYIEHVKDPRYISIKNLIKTGSLFGLQYIYGTFTAALWQPVPFRASANRFLFTAIITMMAVLQIPFRLNVPLQMAATR